MSKKKISILTIIGILVIGLVFYFKDQYHSTAEDAVKSYLDNRTSKYEILDMKGPISGITMVGEEGIIKWL